MNQLTNRVAIVTGGAQGLGAAICRRLAEEGADVVVADLKLAQAQETAQQVAQETGRRVSAQAVNVSDEAQVQALFDAVTAQYGRVDLVVANAGIVRSGPVDEMGLSDWKLVLDVNLTGFFLTAKYAARAMKAQGSGVIIQINSKSGKKGSYKNGAYAASKFGGIGLTQSVALELAEYGIRVNAICPGNLLDSPLWTNELYAQYAKRLGISEAEVRQRYVDQVPLRRGCTYQDVTNVVVFLASDQSSYMTGQAINVTGGQEMREELMARTFVGFGFGAIQAGLFLAEAHLSRNFDRLVVAEVLPDVVAAVAAPGAFTVNIGHTDHIEALTVAPVEIYRPQVAEDRARLVAAVAEAAEMATALPSVDLYSGGDPAASVAGILAEGLRRKAAAGGPLAVIYTAENNTHAAQLLRAAVLQRVPPAEQAVVFAVVQFLDTIIGKMSGAPEETAGLAPIAPGLPRAFLVEPFNRILIDQVARLGAWADYRRGIEVFVEKPDLAPFAQAKLYGHNAGHALAAYLGHQLGFTRIDQLAGRPDILQFVTGAMLQESGIPLRQRYAGIDPMFTPEGFRCYVEDLIVRMVNPYVRDTVGRVGRDPARKVGWDDRLVGAMRLATAAGVPPRRYAMGVAAALEWLGIRAEAGPAYLQQLWSPARPDENEVQALLDEIVSAHVRLQSWSAAGFTSLATLGTEK